MTWKSHITRRSLCSSGSVNSAQTVSLVGNAPPTVFQLVLAHLLFLSLAVCSLFIIEVEPPQSNSILTVFGFGLPLLRVFSLPNRIGAMLSTRLRFEGLSRTPLTMFLQNRWCSFSFEKLLLIH